jgi:light-harvesting complex I chlorophyll a/b binding protein 4
VAITLQEQMSGQNLPDLSSEAAQTIAAHNDRVAAQTRKRQSVLGLSGLMLMGVAVFATTRRSSHADSASQLSFAPGFKPGFQTKGLRSAIRDPVYVGMSNVQGINEDAILDQQPMAFDPYDLKGEGQATSIAMALAKRLPGTIGSPLSLLATTALASSGDASQLASVFTVLPEEDKEIVEEIKVSVLDKAKSMAGVSAPLDFFDPLGFCTDCTEGKLCFYREVEVKHGRVAMLASLGFIVGEQFHPLFGGNNDLPSYIAFQSTPLQTFWPAVVAAIAIPEVFSVFTFKDMFASEDGEQMTNQLWEVKTDRVAGDLGFDPLGLKPQDPAELKEMQTKELNNGRLAMLAAAGMIAQELVNGEKILGPAVLGTAADVGRFGRL